MTVFLLAALGILAIGYVLSYCLYVVPRDHFAPVRFPGVDGYPWRVVKEGVAFILSPFEALGPVLSKEIRQAQVTAMFKVKGDLPIGMRGTIDYVLEPEFFEVDQEGNDEKVVGEYLTVRLVFYLGLWLGRWSVENLIAHRQAIALYVNSLLRLDMQPGIFSVMRLKGYDPMSEELRAEFARIELLLAQAEFKPAKNLYHDQKFLGIRIQSFTFLDFTEETFTSLEAEARNWLKDLAAAECIRAFRLLKEEPRILSDRVPEASTGLATKDMLVV